MSEKMEKIVLDSGSMYPLKGESQEEFEARMTKLDIEREARMTDEDKRLSDELVALSKIVSKKFGYD